MKEKLIFKPKYVTDALRHQGYNAYTAIEDIIDNSLESEVGAKHVDIHISKNIENNKIRSIIIADDGCGMTLPILKEAMAFGSETGKSRRDNLGSYGAGLKSACLGIAQSFYVYTKKENESVIHSVLFDIREETIEENDGDILINYTDYAYTPEALALMQEDAITGRVGFGWEEHARVSNDFDRLTNKAGKGTVVVIYNIDRSIPSNLNAFKERLIGHLRRTYTFFLNKKYAGVDMDDVIKNNVEITVDGTPLRYFDIIGIDSNLDVVPMYHEIFDVDGVQFEYYDFYMPSSPSAEKDDKDHFGRALNHTAVNIARNGRFTSLGNKFGIYFDQHAAGYKALLLVDGDSDALLGATYRKTSNDSTASSVDPTLWKYLEYFITRGKAEATNRQKKDHNNDPVSKEAKDTIDKVLNDMAKNPLLKDDESIKDIMSAARKLRNENRKRKEDENAEKSSSENTNDTEKSERKEHGESDPSSKKERLVRSYKNIIDIIMENNGPREALYTVSKNDINGKIEIYINADHVYFDDVLGQEKSDAAYYGWQQIIINALTLERVGYFKDETKREHLDEFLLTSSSYLDSSVNGNRPDDRRV